ncbi:MAG: phage tail tape measure protein, partial [Cytophagaceae bacterium]
MQNLSKNLTQIGREMQTIGTKLTYSISTPLAAMGALSMKAAMDFESAFAGVKKTVDATEDQFAQLEQGIRDMAKSIPASTTEISAVAEAAGSLGVQADNVLSFTRTMIDLGNTTNLSAEEAANSMARFANIVGTSQKDFDRLGSTIVDLGNKLATTEAEIMDMGLRLAGAGHQAGMSEGEILGFAAALSSVGINAEAGGSAFSTVIKNIQKSVELGDDKLATFAKTAGMSVKDFSELFRKDASQALLAFIKGLDNVKNSGGSVLQRLEELDLDEIRVSDALLRASASSDLFARSLEIGNKAFSENTALAAEAEKRYVTMASQIQVMKNKFSDLGITIGNDLAPHFKKIVDVISEWVTRFSGLDAPVRKVIILIGGIAIAIGPVIYILGTLATAIAAISLPVVLVVAAVGAAVAAIVIYWDELSAYFATEGNVFSQLAETAFIAFDTLSNVVKVAVDIIAFYWSRMGTAIMQKISTMWNFVLNTFNYFLGLINNVVNVFKGIFTGNWELVWESVKNIFKLSVNQLINIVTLLLSTVLDTFATVAGAFGADEIQAKINGVKKTINDFSESIKFNVNQTENATKAFNGFKEALGSAPKMPDLGPIAGSPADITDDNQKSVIGKGTAKEKKYVSADKTRDDRFALAIPAMADTPMADFVPMMQAAQIAHKNFALQAQQMNQIISQSFKQAANDAIAATAEMVGSAIAGGNGLK